MHQKDNPHKPLAKVKRTREEMQTTLNNRKKVTTYCLRSALKRKNKVEEKGVSSLRVKKEHENTYLRAQKMMRGRVKPYVVRIVVKAVPPVVQAIR
jgi:hypothetical protein